MENKEQLTEQEILKTEDNPKKEKGKIKEFLTKKRKLKKLTLIQKILYWFIILLMLSVLIVQQQGTTEITKGTISYNEFLADVKDGDIEVITISGSKTFKTTYKEGKGLEERKDKEGNVITNELVDGKRQETVIHPQSDTFIEEMSKKGIEIQYESSSFSLTIFVLILTNLPMILLIFLMYFYITRMFGMGKSKSEGEIKKVTTLFSDVAGMTEEKEEILFAINSLKNPQEYENKGVKPIKGILLEGPPGVGKTLLAKAVAGEAGVNFLSYSGSDFVEMFAGLGAQRVRGMYKKALEIKPCVVFIDEIDALGRKRINGGNGGTQEADQTLVALLEKMDGMNSIGGILFIGATNRVDTLDSALLRPGRFDKIIHIGPPKTKEDREAIVQVHAQNKQLADGVTIEKIAKQCYGMTGAEIESALNDAVLESFKAKRDGIITIGDIDAAIMKLMSRGLAKGRHSEEDRVRVAIHEAGHALMNRCVGREVVKVSIQPYSSGVGGITMINGESKGVDGLQKASDIRNDIKVLYAGKVAEEIMLGECSIGASNDLERATFLLRNYVGAYGMQKGVILSLVGLSRENMLITANEELLRKMESEGQNIYSEVESFFNQDKIKSDMNKLVAKLLEDEVVYNLDEIEEKEGI